MYISIPRDKGGGRLRERRRGFDVARAFTRQVDHRAACCLVSVVRSTLYGFIAR